MLFHRCLSSPQAAPINALQSARSTVAALERIEQRWFKFVRKPHSVFMRTFQKPKQNHSQPSCSLSLRFLNGFHMSSSRHGHSPKGSKRPKAPGSSQEGDRDRERGGTSRPCPGLSHPILLQGLAHPLWTQGTAGCARGLGGFPKGNEFWGQPYLPRRPRVTESSAAAGDTGSVGFKSAGTTSQRSCSKAGGEGKQLSGVGTRF